MPKDKEKLSQRVTGNHKERSVKRLWFFFPCALIQEQKVLNVSSSPLLTPI